MKGVGKMAFLGSPKRHYEIGIIGAGNMGQALIRGLLRSKLLRPHEIIASGVHRERLARVKRKYKIFTTTSNPQLIQEASTIILAVKPQTMGELLPEIRPYVRRQHLVISIAAGIDIARLKTGLGNRVPMVRVMPNLPALIGQGVAGLYCTRYVPPAKKRFAHQIFQAVGSTVDVPVERWLDAITGLSGTGPAYLFALLEAMTGAGEKVGLPRKVSRELTLQSVAGAANMALETRIPPEVLRSQVTSKKGTTWAAMKIFKKRKFWRLLEEAIRHATRRAAELRKT